MKYKTSFYTIITDKIPNTNVNIIFSTKTAKAFNINNKYVRYLNKNYFDPIPNDILETLISSEIIVPDFMDELEEICESAKRESLSDKDDYLHMTLMNSADCQLGCFYCGQKHNKKIINNEVIKLFEKRLQFLFANKTYKHLNISWFGGEPLMGLNKMREANKIAKKCTKQNNCVYTSHLVTNGLSLKENIYKELAVDFNSTFIEITLDGTKEYHDKRRNTKQNVDTFNIILGNLLEIVNLKEYPINNCKISIRCNVDDTNRDGVIPLIELLAKNNLQKKISFYTAPVYHWGNNAHLNTNKEDYAISEIDYLLKLYELGFDVQVIPNLRNVVCSAVTPNYELIDPWGKVYNCTEIPLVPMYGNEYIIGDLKKNVQKLIPFKDRPYVNWYDEIKDTSNGYWCTNCKVLPLCGGRCPKSWKDGVPPCPSLKINIEDRLMLAQYIISNSKSKTSSENRIH